MRQVTLAIMACSAFSFSTFTYASDPDSKYYFGIDYHVSTYNEKDIPYLRETASGSSTINPTALRFKGGIYLAEDIAIEGSVHLGSKGDTTEVIDQFVGPTTLTTEIDYIASLAIKGELPLTTTANLYGLVGFSKGKFTEHFPSTYPYNQTMTHSDSGLSYGLGANYMVTNRVSLNAEYVLYWSEYDTDYTALNIGFTRSF